MATIGEQLERVQILDKERISAELFNFIKSIQTKFTEQNKEQLNKESTDIFGDPIGYYSKATEWITTNQALLGKRNDIKREGEPYTMYETGEFLQRLFIKIEGDKIHFGSSDPKTPLILDNDNLLSRDLFGLTDENLRELIEQDLLPFLLNLQRQTLDV